MTDHMHAARDSQEHPSALTRSRLTGTVSLANFWAAIVACRFAIAVIMTLSLIGGIFYAHFSGVTYSARMSVIAAESAGEQTKLQIPGILGGTTQTVTRFTQFELSLVSSGMAALLDQRYKVYCDLYPGRCNGSGAPDTSMLHGLRLWLGSASATNTAPRVLAVMDYVERKLGVNHADNNRVLILETHDDDPQVAMTLLQRVFSVTNDYLRIRDQARYVEYVNYLTAQLNRSNINVDQRLGLQSILLEEQRNLMMANVNTPYAAAVLDPPTLYPKGSVIKIFFGLLVGAAISFGLVLIRLFAPRWRV